MYGVLYSQHPHNLQAKDIYQAYTKAVHWVKRLLPLVSCHYQLCSWDKSESNSSSYLNSKQESYLISMECVIVIESPKLKLS